MAQMPIQLVSGRAQTHLAPSPADGPPPVARKPGQPFDSGAISGGPLRPGAIEQKTFRQRMAELNRADPPAGGVLRPPATAAATTPAVATPAPGIPTLTPAQLAALGVDISGLAAAPATAADSGTDSAVDSTVDFTADSGTEPLAAPAAPPPGEAALDPAAETAAVPPAAATVPAEAAPRGPMPGARLGADGVWELPRHPGKDERAWLQGMNAKWRLVENPDSVKLFLGEDGRFGFDDLLDIVNPLQHIPLVNIAYRALTGDTIDGAAQLLGAIPFGPLSVAGTMTDLAFRAQTGAGLAENGLAMIFGGGPATEEIATASGRMQTAEALQIRRGSNR